MLAKCYFRLRVPSIICTQQALTTTTKRPIAGFLSYDTITYLHVASELLISVCLGQPFVNGALTSITVDSCLVL